MVWRQTPALGSRALTGTVVSVLAAVSSVLFAAAPAHASFPGANGGLASEYREIDRGGRDDMEIQLFGLDGIIDARLSPCSRPETEPPSGTCPNNPSFSPDGRRIAFDLGGRLALVAPDGSGLLTLPKLTEADVDPAFSPDGTMLVFTGLAGGRHNLYTVAVDGSSLQALTHVGGSSAAWSSGRQIAYCAGGQIWRLRPGTPRRTRVAKGCHPDFSPSGKTILYDYKRDTYRVPARQGAARKLSVRRAERPTFSPNSKQIAFERQLRKDSIGASIYTADASTGKRLKLIRRGGEVQPIGSTYDYFTGVAWQPLR